MLLSHWSIAPFCVDEAFSTLLGRRVCHNRVRSHFVVPSFWKEGSGVVETKKVRPFHKHMIYNRLCHYFSLPPLTPPPRRRGPQAATFRPLFLFWHSLERPVNVPRLTSACERPVFFCPIANECPVSFFGQTQGSAPTVGWKTPFCAPQLRFRCISNTLQSYEKFLKLTNCKHKTFKKLFVGAAILLCIKQLQKFKSKILITNDLRHFYRPYLPHSFSLQITVFLWAHHPQRGLKNSKICK